MGGERLERGSQKPDERSRESKEIVRNLGGIQERSNPKKREGAEAGNRRKKKLKYAPLGEEWGYTNMEEQQAQLPLELAPKSTIDREQPESQLQPPPKEQRAAGRRRGGKPYQALEREPQEPAGRLADVSESVSSIYLLSSHSCGQHKGGGGEADEH